MSTRKPVKLQALSTCTWRDVAYFDAADDAVSDQVMQGAEQIGRATGAKFRIVIRDSLNTVLTQFEPKEGWRRAGP